MRSWTVGTEHSGNRVNWTRRFPPAWWVCSEKERALQMADAVAWALFQKYERRDETLWQVIQGNVIEVGM